MCGVVGYVGSGSCLDYIFSGLSKLEYRGYDSSGIATIEANELKFAKAKGKLAELAPKLEQLSKRAPLGIGHTRWATHGVPSEVNAHPHVGENIAIVHNGIIENYSELRAELEKDGVVFKSETDTEVVLHLLEKKVKTLELHDAIFETISLLKGAYALGIIHKSFQDKLYVVKHGSPAVIGVGDGETFLASDVMAFSDRTNKAVFLDDGEVALLEPSSFTVWNSEGEQLNKKPMALNISSTNTGKNGYRHYMLKEIHEQPAVFASMIDRFIDRETKTIKHNTILDGSLNMKRVDNITMVACGTAHYACMMGRYFLEQALGVPVNVELASEYRYRDPFVNEKTLLIAVTQSGETADTLACVQYAKKQNCQVMSVCNVQYSAIPRASDATVYMEAGPEIGVASTKAFTSQLFCLYLWGLSAAQQNGKLTNEKVAQAVGASLELPVLLENAIGIEKEVEHIAAKYYEATSMIYIGRGLSYAIALEGALKLKEISYIHAEGYPAGELKHGPIALVDKHLPVISIAPRDHYYEKTISNIEEIKSREAQLIAVGEVGDEKLANLVDDFIGFPVAKVPELQPILSVISLQLFSYYVAVKRGTDVDQPRNLAKSVTVE